MADRNVFQQQITPVKPKVLSKERVFVYVPRASGTTEGIASYNPNDFNVNNGQVTIKRNNPFDTETVVKIDDKDFLYDNGIVKVNWPYAQNSSGSANTNGFGLVKIDKNSNGYLKFDENGLLEVDIKKLRQDNKVLPTYGADKDSGFEDYDNYVDVNGYAKLTEQGYPKLSITKEAVGLNKVENKAFSDYVYNDFGDDMKNHFVTEFATKLNKSEFDKLFNDWNPPSDNKSTPQKWLTILDAEDEAIWESLTSLKIFLGYFQTIQDLEAAYPASRVVYGSTAYILQTNSYWAVKADNVDYMLAFDEDLASFIEKNKDTLKVGDKIGINETAQVYEWDGTNANLTEEKVKYVWYDTHVDVESITEYMETDAKVFRPDGIASAGTSGMWAQSDHIHPTDTTRLAKDAFDNTIVKITTELNSSNPNFEFTLSSTDLNRGVNIPYVRKAKTIHNWNNQTVFSDNEQSSESYWRGSVADFNNQMNDIPNNSVCMVEDTEGLIADDLVTKNTIEASGITLNSDERFIITNNDTEAQNLVGNLLTLKRTVTQDDYKYLLEKYTISGNNGEAIGFDGQGGFKTLDPRDIAVNHSTYMLCITSNKEVCKYEPIDYILRSYSTAQKGILFARGASGLTSTYTTKGSGKLLVSDGQGFLTESTITTGKLLYTSDEGVAAPLPMTASDVGKFVGVSNTGEPTLLVAPVVPTVLPVATYTTDPGDNTVGTVLCKLDSDPGEYSEGVIYLW